VRRLLVRPDPQEPSTLLLDPPQARHALKVLRLRPGDRFLAFDGAGHHWEAELVQTTPAVRARVVGPVPAPTVPYRLTLYQGLPKGDRMDLVVRMGTELGVAAFVPVRTRRTVATGERLDRWRRVAAEAAKQCGRPTIPQVARVVDFPKALERFQLHQLRLVLWERATDPLTHWVSASPAEDLALFVGPEGGFDPEEVARLQTAGVLCSLGPLVLRTETAAVAAAAVVLGLQGFTPPQTPARVDKKP